jgi:hypothetical protein
MPPPLKGCIEVLYSDSPAGPSQMDLKLSWISVFSASSFLMAGKRKKSTGARSGTWGVVLNDPEALGRLSTPSPQPSE